MSSALDAELFEVPEHRGSVDAVPAGELRDGHASDVVGTKLVQLWSVEPDELAGRLAAAGSADGPVDQPGEELVQDPVQVRWDRR